MGPHQGRKVFTLQTLPASKEPFDEQVGKGAGFSLHAGVAAGADERQKLERLCRYIARPAVSEKRLSLTTNGNVRYDVKGFTNVAGAGCAGATSSKHRTAMAPRTSSSSLWTSPLLRIHALAALVHPFTSSPGWPP